MDTDTWLSAARLGMKESMESHGIFKLTNKKQFSAALTMLELA